MVFIAITFIIAVAAVAGTVYLFLQNKKLAEELNTTKINMKSLETTLYNLKNQINTQDDILDGVIYNHTTKTAIIGGNLKVTGWISAGNANKED